MRARPTHCRVRTTKIGAQVASEGKLTLAYIANYGITPVVRKANADLIVAAWNACVEINPENPIAAAEAMPEIFRLLSDAVSDALKVSHGKLDPEKWLREASAAVARAIWKD